MRRAQVFFRDFVEPTLVGATVIIIGAGITYAAQTAPKEVQDTILKVILIGGLVIGFAFASLILGLLIGVPFKRDEQEFDDDCY